MIRGGTHSPQRTALALMLACVAAPAAHAQRLIVVSSSDSIANTRAIAGMRDNPGWTIDAVRIGTPERALDTTLRNAPAATPVVTLGAKAAQYVAQAGTAAPIVDCLVQGDLHGTPAAAVPLAIPIDVQVGWMKRLLPAARTVAILFDPTQNERTAANAAQQLAAAGYTVLAEPVSSPEALPPALTKVAKADALLALPDSTVYSPELAKGLLLFTYRSNTPMIALSDAWVRAGALYALEWDYAKLGKYCAELAVWLVASPRNAAPPQMPAPQVSVNRRAAAQLHLKWDAATLAGVDHVHD